MENKSTAITTTGELREFLAKIAVGITNGKMKVTEAAIAVKACEQINASFYSEIKNAQIQVGLKLVPTQLGNLSLLDEK